MEENYGLRQEGDYYSKVTLRADKPTTDSDMDQEDLQATDDYLKVAAYAEEDLTDDRTFEELCQLIDMDNLLQYFAIETYIANWDWPLNNIKLYRYYSSNGMYGEDRQDGRWRYLYYDMEVGFNIFNEAEEDWLTIADVMEESSLFGAVMKRTDCQERFAKYLQLCIQEYFTEEKVQAAIDQLKSERDQELAESFDYKHSVDETYTLDMEEVEQNLEVIRQFVERRPEMIRQEVQELFGITMDQ
jgi:hypothetical protein